jgi:hypothetical protein
MNRIILKINFIGIKGLRIDLCHLDPRFQTKDKFLSFNTDAYDFVLYSRSKMSISENSFRLPDENNYKKDQFIEKEFISEEQRYMFLKGLYKCLHEWNDKYDPFTKDKDYDRRNKNLIMCGEFWII